MRFLINLFTVLVYSLQWEALYSQNLNKIDSLSIQLIQTNDSIAKIELLLALSSELIGSQPSESLIYAKRAYDISEQRELPLEMILSLIQISECYLRISDFIRAMENAEHAVEKAAEFNFRTEKARAKGMIALVYYHLGDYEKSATIDFENLGYYESINDQKQVGIVLGNIGVGFVGQENYKKALEYLNKSFEIAMENNDYHGMAYQYNNIAGIYFEFYNDYKMAQRYYNEALAINEALGDLQQHGIYLMNIGSCFLKLNEKDSALTYLNHADQIAKNLNNDFLHADCQILMGELFFQNQETERSKHHADIAFRIALDLNHIDLMRTVSGLLHKIYLSTNDTANAYRYAMLENAAKDSLLVLQNQKEIYKLEFQYNFEKAERIREIARKKKENLFIIIILSLGFGLILFALIISRQRFKAKSAKLEKHSIEKELQFKNKELTLNLLALIKKNTMLEELSKKLNEVGQGAKKEETRIAISKISREIRRSTEDKMLKEFSLQFQEVHMGFYEKLLERFPDLSQNELKLCALLRLNMSSKDISELTGQRILTIEHARYRLRKKLGISNTEVNLNTFLSQL